MPPDEDLILPAASTAAWCLAPRVALHFRRWDQDWLLFDEGSGQTHRIDTLTALTLMVLEAGASGPSAIASAIGEELALQPAEAADLVDRVPAVLEALQQLGIVIAAAGDD